MKKEETPEVSTADALKAAANADWQAPEKPAKMVRLTVHKPEGDPSTEMFLAVNFRAYQIQYGTEVEVPQDVVDALKATHITTQVVDPHTEKLRSISAARFAYSTEAV